MKKEPEIYFFDMDHTLINNDCDVSWKHFVVAEKLAGQEALEQADYFYDQYAAGTLDINEFMRFQLNEFTGRTELEMAELAQKHFVDFVKEKIYMDAFELVQRLKVLEKPVILLSATNVVIARPIAEYFGFDDCLATELELVDGKYTGCISGVYTMGKGKIEVAREYCKARNITLDEVAYYGDSINDVYILDAVGFPIAVNPGEELRKTAEKHNWEILNFE